MLWLWELRDIGIIGVGLLISVLALTQTGIALPLVLTAVYAFLSIRFDGTSILDFLKYAAAFLITKQQFYANREDLERNLPQSNKAENADMRGAYAVSGRGGIAHEPAVDKPRRRGGKQMKTYGEEDL